jgi:DNA-binding beta-propeller fold protein YncE
MKRCYNQKVGHTILKRKGVRGLVRKILAILLADIVLVLPAVADVWVAYEGGICRYTDAGEQVLNVTRYRNPISLALDAGRGRLWFVEQYDYTVVCIDTTSGKELFRLKDVVHSPPTVTTDTYSSTEADNPPGLAVDGNDGSLWVADIYGHQVARLDESAYELWRSSDFHEPYSVTVATDGSGWIVGGISDIFRLTANGEVVYKRKKGLNEPRDVTVDTERGLVWIAEYGNSRVLAIDYDGNLRRKVNVELPWNLSIDPEKGLVWATSTYENVYKISSAGKLELTVDRFETPADVIVAPGLGVWVADRGDDRVILLNSGGERLLKIEGVHKPISLAVE